MSFKQKLENIILKNNSLLCVGLDPINGNLFRFNKKIIDETYDLVCAYKPNIAHYSALGISGLKSLQKTIKYIHTQYNDTPVILDAKRSDIGSTSLNYAIEVFKIFEADAVTVNPYLGFDAIEPFLKYKNKGIIILCRTSNSGASDFQDLKIDNEELYIKVAQKVVQWDKKYNNCLMVVGATWPKQLENVRKIAKDMFFLVPGIGAQGGNLEKTLKYGLTKNKSGLIISSSRGIIFSKDPRKEAEKLKEEINKYRYG